MPCKLLILTLSCLLFVGQAKAGPRITSGYGVLLCKNFNDSPDPLKEVFYSWEEGFMSAVNDLSVSSKNTYIPVSKDIESDNRRRNLVISICSKHPEISFKEATVKMMELIIIFSGKEKYK